MPSDEKIVRVETLDDFDRELARDGGEGPRGAGIAGRRVRPLPRGRGHRGRDPRRLGGSARPRGGRAMKHDEYHRQFAEGIIEQIRQGTAPWQKPWGPGRARASRPTLIPDAPTRAGTACTSPPSSRSAATPTCAGEPTARSKPRDGQVRKGEQGTRILSFQDHRKIAVNDERGRPVRDGEGNRIYRYERMRAPVVRQYNVFNAEQADGAPGLDPLPPPSRSGRSTRRPNASSRTAGFPSVTWPATGRSTT